MSILRVLWVVLAVSMGLALRDAGLVAAVVWWVAVGVVVVALVVPGAAGLTAVRMITPAAVPTAVLALGPGAASAATGILAIAVAVVTTLVAYAGETGEAMVQGAAYGNERRFPLRVPAALLLPMALSWLVWCTAILLAVVFLAGETWVVGALCAVVATGLTWLLAQRFHRLSRRWLVLVPAGVVVHDRLVLGETLMVQRTNVTEARLALAGTEAADLTGPAAGHALEVAVREMALVVFPSTREHPKGRAIHVQSFLVAPSRPGRALRAMADAHLPVG